MKLLRCSPVLLLAAVIGCSGGPRAESQIELMSVERRWLEDELYAVKDDLKKASERLQRLQDENLDLRRQLRGQPEPGTSTPPGDAPRSSAPLPPAPEEISSLNVDLGSQVPLPETRSRRDEQQEEQAAPLSLPRVNAPVKAPLTGPVSSPVDPRRTRTSTKSISIDGERTTEANWDDDPQPDGLSLVLQFSGRPAETGIQIDVLPAQTKLSEQPSSFAHWEVTSEQLRQLVASSRSGRIRLELDWPAGRPTQGLWTAVIRFDDARAQIIDKFSFNVVDAAATSDTGINDNTLSPIPAPPEAWTPRPARRRRVSWEPNRD